jgi:hypothetical protein
MAGRNSRTENAANYTEFSNLRRLTRIAECVMTVAVHLNR